MKAVRMVKVGQPLQAQEVDIPTIGEKDVLVRVKAAGICHSDAHYRAGRSSVGPLPITLGHEIAGIIEEVGNKVSHLRAGNRVCIHYMLTCGSCFYCRQGVEQFCASGRMVGKSVNGGFAEYLVVPAQNAFLLPEEIPLEYGAVMMCSSATAYHALSKGRLKNGETVAVFGLGGLGMSAIQLAKVFGAFDVFGVDTNKGKLELAEKLGAIPVDASKYDPVAVIRQFTSGKGVDVSLEVIGLPQTMLQAIQSLSILGRAVMVGISDKTLELFTYRDLLWREAEIIGCADHLLQEIPTLIETVRRGRLDLRDLITCTIPLDENKINATLDELEEFTSKIVRTVIVP